MNTPNWFDMMDKQTHLAPLWAVLSFLALSLMMFLGDAIFAQFFALMFALRLGMTTAIGIKALPDNRFVLSSWGVGIGFMAAFVMTALYALNFGIAVAYGATDTDIINNSSMTLWLGFTAVTWAYTLLTLAVAVCLPPRESH